MVLVVAKPEHYHQLNQQLLEDILKNKKSRCVYLSLNKPHHIILARLKIPPGERFFIVDCVSRLASEEIERVKNVVFIDSPRNLQEIGLVLDGIGKSVHLEDSYLFLDNLSTLLLYNKIRNVALFIHFLSAKLRHYKMAGIILSVVVDQEHQALINQIVPFCDHFIQFEKNNSK